MWQLVTGRGKVHTQYKEQVMLAHAIYATLNFPPPRQDTQQATDNLNLDEDDLLSDVEAKGGEMATHGNFFYEGWVRGKQSTWWKPHSLEDKHLAPAKY